MTVTAVIIEVLLARHVELSEQFARFVPSEHVQVELTDVTEIIPTRFPASPLAAFVIPVESDTCPWLVAAYTAPACAAFRVSIET